MWGILATFIAMAAVINIREGRQEGITSLLILSFLLFVMHFVDQEDKKRG